MVETKFVSDTLWKSQGEPAGEFQRKTVLEDEQRVNSKELQTMADGGVIDSVALCGDNMGGSFIYSLVATDGWTGRTGAVPLLAREQSMVVKGLEAVAKQLPCTVQGIDSDNYSVLVNDTLTEFCADRGIDFTRSRACRKNHQAWVKQKSGAVTRRLPGHERCSRQVAGQTLDRLHGAIRLYVNFFQPSFKLMEKTRQGSVEAKSYTSPATPQERLIQHERFGAEARASMNERRARLSPVVKLHSIREPQAASAANVSPEVRTTPRGESLVWFLTRLPDRWRQH